MKWNNSKFLPVDCVRLLADTTERTMLPVYSYMRVLNELSSTSSLYMKKLACAAKITRWLLFVVMIPCIAHRGKLPTCDKWSIGDRTLVLAFLVALEAERATQETSQWTSESGSLLSLGSVGNPQSCTQETTSTQRDRKRRFYSYVSLFTVRSSYRGTQKVGG